MSRAAALVGTFHAAGASLAMSYTPNVSATYNSAYTGATPSTTGGTPPYTYSSIGSALPTGITLNTSTGVLSGTDSTDSSGATYAGIQLRVTDSAAAHVDSSTFTITVSTAGGFALIGHASAASAGGAGIGATTAAIDTTGADLLVATLGMFWNNTSTVTDSKGNTWTPVVTQHASANGVLQQNFYCHAPTVGTGHTFTVTPVGGSTTTPSIIVAAFSGSLTSPLDTQAIGTGLISTMPIAASITPSAGRALVIATEAHGQGAPDGGVATSIDGSFTLIDEVTYSNAHHAGLAMAYLIQTSAAAAHPQWTLDSSREWTAEIDAFKAA